MTANNRFIRTSFQSNKGIQPAVQAVPTAGIPDIPESLQFFDGSLAGPGLHVLSVSESLEEGVFCNRLFAH